MLFAVDARVVVRVFRRAAAAADIRRPGAGQDDADGDAGRHGRQQAEFVRQARTCERNDTGCRGRCDLAQQDELWHDDSNERRHHGKIEPERLQST